MPKAPSKSELRKQNIQLLRRVNDLTKQLNEAQGNPRMPAEDARYMTVLEDENMKLTTRVRLLDKCIWNIFQTLAPGYEPPEYPELLDAQDALNFLQTLRGKEEGKALVCAFASVGHWAVQRGLEQASRKKEKSDVTGQEANPEAGGPSADEPG